MDLSEIKDLEAKIRVLAESALSSGRPYLLSKLGNDLGPDLKILKAQGTTLADFLRSQFEGEYAIVFTGQYQNIQALVRASGDAGNAPGVHLEVVGPPAEKKPSRFHYRFWSAFSVPQQEGVRYLNLDTLIFTDSNFPPDAPTVVVESEYIAPADLVNRDAAILENIKSWSKKHDISLDRFLLQPASRKAAQRDGTSLSILEAMINALDKRQLASTTLTMEVVAELLRKRV